MKYKISKKLMLGVLALAFSGVVASEADAQTFENTGSGKYQATCGGKLRLKASGAAGAFTSALGTPQGTAGAPIPGIVEWNSTAAQTVKAYYYTLLLLNGTGAKTVETGVHIVPSTCTTMDGSGNTGTTGADYAYVVVPGSGNVDYGTGNTLNIDGSTTLQPNTDGTTYTNHASYPNVVVNDGTGSTGINIAGNVKVETITDLDTDTDGGKININNGGDLTITGTGSEIDGSVTIADGGTLTMDNGSDLTLSGDNTNGGTINADCASTITYDGTTAQNVMAASADNTAGKGQYGNLTLTGGVKNAAGNVDVCQAFTLNANANNFNTLVGAENYTLTMLNSNGGSAAESVVNYGGEGEVVGQMAWDNMDKGTPDKVFNNAYTTAKIVEGTGISLTLKSQPGTNPKGYESTTDVNRKVNIVEANNVNKLDLAIGYKLTEQPATGFDIAKSRFYGDGETVGKIAASYTSDATNFQVKGASIDFATAAGFGNLIAGEDVVIRSKENIDLYAVKDGRWSNVNTWDEKRTPTENDNVIIMANVYAGISNPNNNFLGSTNTGSANNVQGTYNDYPESTLYTADAFAANNVTIPDAPDDATKYGLVVGNEDNSANYLLKFKGVFANNNTKVMAGDDASATGFGSKTARTTAYMQGLWILDEDYIGTGKVEGGISAKQVTNVGTINNASVIEVGE